MTYGFVPPPTCGKHDWWVAVIGATGDGSNDHRPVGQLIVSSFIMKGDGVVLLLGCNLEASKSNLCKCAHKDTLNRSFVHSTECSKAMVHSASYGHVEKKNERQVLDVWGFITQSSDCVWDMLKVHDAQQLWSSWNAHVDRQRGVNPLMAHSDYTGSPLTPRFSVHSYLK